MCSFANTGGAGGPRTSSSPPDAPRESCAPVRSSSQAWPRRGGYQEPSSGSCCRYPSSPPDRADAGQQATDPGRGAGQFPARERTATHREGYRP
jgi:hypothetical protein